MRQKLLAIGDDFWIENDRGERAYKVNGKALRVRQTFILENSAGDEIARIKERKLSIRDRIVVQRYGKTAATVCSSTNASAWRACSLSTNPEAPRSR
jgi:uncharacterized protein YxjI